MIVHFIVDDSPVWAEVVEGAAILAEFLEAVAFQATKPDAIGSIDNFRTPAAFGPATRVYARNPDRNAAEPDRSLSQLIRMGPECWTEQAVRQLEEWKRVRTLAADALDSFAWRLETPPSHADEFVGGP